MIDNSAIKYLMTHFAIRDENGISHTDTRIREAARVLSESFMARMLARETGRDAEDERRIRP